MQSEDEAMANLQWTYTSDKEQWLMQMTSLASLHQQQHQNSPEEQHNSQESELHFCLTRLTAAEPDRELMYPGNHEGGKNDSHIQA